MSDQLKPLPEWEGNAKIKKFCKLLDRIGTSLTVVGLFVSIGGLEMMVGLLGLAISGLARSKRFVRWVGKRGIVMPPESEKNFFSDPRNNHRWRH